MARWISFRFDLSAEIGGVTFPHVVQYTASFGLGGIPQASLLLPVGRECQSLKPAAIHAAYAGMRVQQPAKVYLDITLLGSSGDVPNRLWTGRKLIFDGYATGVSWSRSSGGAQATVGLLHWLSDLHYSSALSGTSHPGNPADFTFGSCFKNLPLGGAGADGGGSPNWVPCPASDRAISAADIQGDLWENVLKAWMITLSKQDPIDEYLASGESGGNAAALKALNRMHGRNMGMVINAADADAVAEGVRNALANESWQSWVNTTLWGKLIGDWCPAYWFTVVPRVTDALVVPISGGVRKTYKAIYASEYNSLETTCAMKQVLGNVGIVHPIKFQCGGELNAGEQQADCSGLAAVWPANPRNDGLKLLKDAPKWLSDPIFDREYAKYSTGAAGEILDNPFDPQDIGQQRVPARDPAETQKQFKPVLTDYAHQWYVNESLKGRLGELSGALRFDICPGSSVWIEGAKERFIQDDNTGQPFYATVFNVSYVINAEMQRCGTTFSLAHIRNEAENQDDRYSVTRPPLYETAFVGEALIP